MATAVDDFLRGVLRSGLMSREQLQLALRPLAREQRDDPDAVVELLTRENYLTPFQAQKIRQGLTNGLVVGPYQIQAPLGKGGMGVVYLALDTRGFQHVALKVLPPKRARAEERQLARFQREMAMSQQVQHPHLALSLDVGVSGNIHYLALEYIPGQTLHRLVTKEGPIAVPRAARLFVEVAAALAHAHGLGLIHRDLKPSNIMVTPNDHAKVLDLGLAFRAGESVEDVEVVGGKGYVVGSIDYMAPEQTRDATAVDARSDLYALGCCLYFTLTGRPPFPAGNTRDKIQAHRNTEPTLLQNRNPDVPGAFAAIVHKLLAKDPAQRSASAAELAEALRPWGQEAGLPPVETQGDDVYRAAVRHAVTDWPQAELANDALLFKVEQAEQPTAPETGTNTGTGIGSFFDFGSVFGDLDESQRKVARIILGVAAIWGFVILLLALVVLLRVGTKANGRREPAGYVMPGRCQCAARAWRNQPAHAGRSPKSAKLKQIHITASKITCRTCIRRTENYDPP